MIIFGTTVRHKKIGEGEFFCPKCNTMRQYFLKQTVRSFTLYFIPIFPIQKMGEFVECQTCKTPFAPEARYLREKPKVAAQKPTEEDLATMMRKIKPKLENGYPVEYMVRDLTAAGLDLSVARGAVEGAVDTGRKTCPTCSLSYANTAGTCSGCGGALQ
jgi:hypothetical protein